MGRPRLPWVKVYKNILHSKIMTLKPEQRWIFIGLLLIANDEPERGKIRGHWLDKNGKLLANSLGTSTKLLQNTLKTLAKLSVIILNENEISIKNFVSYQRLKENKMEKSKKKDGIMTQGFSHKRERGEEELEKEEYRDEDKENISHPQPQKSFSHFEDAKALILIYNEIFELNWRIPDLKIIEFLDAIPQEQYDFLDIGNRYRQVCEMAKKKKLERHPITLLKNLNEWLVGNASETWGKSKNPEDEYDPSLMRPAR